MGSAQQELVERGEVTSVRVKQDTGRESRVYEIEASDGVQTWTQSLWSVTTLLKVIDRPALLHWAAKATAQAAFDNLRYLESDLERHGMKEAVYQLSQARFKQKSRAGDIGDRVHKLIEAHILGAERPRVDPELADDVQARFEQFLRWEEEYQPAYRQSEATVYHPDHGWAGTLDFIAQIGRRGEGLVDIKNTNPGGKDDKPGVYLEHVLQCAAYLHAAEIAPARGAWVEPVPMPKLEWAAVLWLYPGRRAFVGVRADEASYTAFRIAAQLYRFVNGPEGRKAILGELTPASFGILPSPEAQAAAVPVVSPAQRRALEAMAKPIGGHDALKRIAAEVCGVDSTTKIPAARFDDVAAAITAAGDPGSEAAA